MNKIIWKLILVANVLLFAALATFVLLAELYPFSPGDAFYPFQDQAEQVRLHYATSRAGRAERAMLHAERRLADLAMAASPEQVKAGGLAFDASLREAVEHLETAPSEHHDALHARLNTLLIQAQVVVRSLEFYVDVSLIDALQNKLGRMQTATTPEQLGSLALRDIEAEPVPFWDEDVDHSIYPLKGGHDGVACESCHPNGLYSNSPTECNDCHKVAQSWEAVSEVFTGNVFAVASRSEPIRVSPNYIYPNHWEGSCDDCHNVYNWVADRFDHNGVTECQSCHLDDVPEPPKLPRVEIHDYPGDCILCHQDVADWSVIEFEHDQTANGHDCYACHKMETPEKHYAGECVECHISLENWDEIYYGHDGDSKNCLSCHQDASPEKHYPGQCSGCHGTDNWSVVNFMHPAGTSNCGQCHATPSHYENQNCAMCHVGDGGLVVFRHNTFDDCASCHAEPIEHYNQNCESCHGGGVVWSAVTYDHTQDYDCTSCHDTVTPSDHYIGDCQSCHGTHTWLDYNFDHTNYQDCEDCHFQSSHYPGQCSNCHTTDNWYDASVDHEIYDDCVSCHPAPSGHWPGQCSDCHATDAWENYTFNHTGYTNCVACHAQDRPPNHPRGQCDRCHNTDGWTIDDPATLILSSSLSAPVLKSRFTPLSRVRELFFEVGLSDDDQDVVEGFIQSTPVPIDENVPPLKKTLKPGTLPELPGDPEVPSEPNLPFDSQDDASELDESVDESVFELAEAQLETQAWQELCQEVVDVAPVELPAVEESTEDGTSVLPVAPPSPEQPSTEETPEPESSDAPPPEESSEPPADG